MGLFNDLFSVVQTHLGTIFVALLFLLVVLGAIYWFTVRMQPEDNLYEERQALIKEALHPASSGEHASSSAAKTYQPSIQPQSVQRPIPPPNQNPGIDEPLSTIGERLKGLRQAAQHKSLPEDMRQSIDNVYEAGKNAMNDGRWEQAKKYFEESLKIHPSDPEIYVKLIIACYELGDLRASEKYYNEAMTRHPLAAKAFHKYLAFRV